MGILCFISMRALFRRFLLLCRDLFIFFIFATQCYNTKWALFEKLTSLKGTCLANIYIALTTKTAKALFERKGKAFFIKFFLIRDCKIVLLKLPLVERVGIGVKYLVVALGVEPKTYSLNAF